MRSLQRESDAEYDTYPFGMSLQRRVSRSPAVSSVRRRAPSSDCVS